MARYPNYYRQIGYYWGVSAKQYRRAVSVIIVTLSEWISRLSDQIVLFPAAFTTSMESPVQQI
jgi:hypothetical protein